MLNHAVKLLGLPALAILFACSSGDNSPSPAPNGVNLFDPPTQQDKAEVRDIWAGRDLSVSAAELIDERAVPDGILSDSRTIRAFRHDIMGSEHFGAVILPNNFEGKRFPTLVVGLGLDQSNGNISASNEARLMEYLSLDTRNFVIVIPSYRGQTLSTERLRETSAGDFCDAYDGAVDDTIAFLNVVEAMVPEADTGRVLAAGISRGGTVVHLLGQRDKRIDMVIAMAGPTDFLRDEVRGRYREQYACQFLDGRQVLESRRQILASSPLHFAEDSAETHMFHTTGDDVVPVWNPREMHDKLQQLGINTAYLEVETGDHGSFIDNPLIKERFGQLVRQFRDHSPSQD